ncbi:MAG: SMC-Scp complex subunit ScpB [Candidatus Omnitrophota bacterium]
MFQENEKGYIDLEDNQDLKDSSEAGDLENLVSEEVSFENVDESNQLAELGESSPSEAVVDNCESDSEVDKNDLDEELVKSVIEAIIFASDKPVSVKQIKSITECSDSRVIKKLIEELKQEYIDSKRSFNLVEIAGGFQFATDSFFARWLKKLYNLKQSEYLSGATLETLAIIAYRQPVTKTDMEFIRGVNVDGIVAKLLQKGLVKIMGRKEVIGRPFVYGTTNLFLQYFGLNSLEELPALPEFKNADLEFKKKIDVMSSAQVHVTEEPAEGGEGEKSEEVNRIT